MLGLLEWYHIRNKLALGRESEPPPFMRSNWLLYSREQIMWTLPALMSFTELSTESFKIYTNNKNEH